MSSCQHHIDHIQYLVYELKRIQQTAQIQLANKDQTIVQLQATQQTLLTHIDSKETIQELINKDQTIVQLQATQQTLQTQLVNKDQTIVQLQATQQTLLTQFDSKETIQELVNKDQTIFQLQATQQTLQTQLFNKDQTIVQLQATQQTLQTQLFNKDHTIVQLQVIQQTLQTQLDDSKETINELNKTVRNKESQKRRLQHKVGEKVREIKARTISKQAKQYKDMTRAGRMRRKNSMKQVLKKIVQDTSVDTTQITIQFDVEGYKTFSQTLKEEQVPGVVEETKSEHRHRMAHTVLEVKDRFRISYKALQALRRQVGLQDIPPIKYLNKESLRLGTYLQILPLHKIHDGCMRPLPEIIAHLLKLPENRPMLDTEADTITIQMRFACDGAKITKRKDSVRGVCKFIPPPGLGRYSRKDSPQDEHTLFLYMGKEDRSTMEEASQAVIQQMKAAATEGVKVGGKTVKVEWILCADWEVMTLLRGINGSHSNYFCPWCHCSKQDIADFSMNWDVQRSLTNQQECLKPNAVSSLGFVNSDLLYFIPYHNMVIDELHLRTRITNTLLTQVVLCAIFQKRQDALLEEMTRIKVPFQFVEHQEDDGKGSVKKWTALAGDQLQSVLDNLNIFSVLDLGHQDEYIQLGRLPKATILQTLQTKTGRRIAASSKKEYVTQELKPLLTPEELKEPLSRLRNKRRTMEDGAAPEEEVQPKVIDPTQLQKVWDDFKGLMASVKARPGTDLRVKPDQFHRDAKEWAEKFRKNTCDVDVTPYIHALVYHLPDMLRRHQYLKDIGVAQVERKNYEQHLVYFQGTSRQGGKQRKMVTEQIMEHENRLMFYRANVKDAAPREESDTRPEESENAAGGEKSDNGVRGEGLDSDAMGEELDSDTSDGEWDSDTRGEDLDSDRMGEELDSDAMEEEVDSDVKEEELDCDVKKEELDCDVKKEELDCECDVQEELDCDVQEEELDCDVKEEKLDCDVKEEKLDSDAMGEVLDRGVRGEELDSDAREGGIGQ